MVLLFAGISICSSCSNVIISKGLPDSNHARKQYRCIRACAVRANSYMKQYLHGDSSALPKAMIYYNRVINLTEETDSDLGDNLKAIKERDRTDRALARYYNRGIITIGDDVRGCYVGPYINAAKIDLHNRYTGPLTDSTGVVLRFAFGNSSLSPDTKRVLDSVVSDINSHPDKRVVVSGWNVNWSLPQQISWEQVNTCIEYLVERYGLLREKFISDYIGSQQPNHILIRLAKHGEDGQSNPPPPHPFYRNSEIPKDY